jgi:peptide/nickel transport system permease protein
MPKYVIKKLLLLIPVILCVSTVVFFMIHFIPGDPAQILAGEQAAPQDVENLRKQLGLDRPLLVQYVTFLKNVSRLDFGRSLRTNEKVTTEIWDRYPNTLCLAFCATLFSILVGIPIGVFAALKKNSIFDGLSMTGALLGMAMPDFWLGLILIYCFGVKLGWLPVMGFSTVKHLILPSITLGSFATAYVARMTRSSMLETLRQDFILAARAKGLSLTTVLYKHALKNSLIPVVTVVGLGFSFMLGGSFIIETVFVINGLGWLVVRAILMRDFPVVQGGIFIISSTFVIMNILVDIAYAYLDPRIKFKD